MGSFRKKIYWTLIKLGLSHPLASIIVTKDSSYRHDYKKFLSNLEFDLFDVGYPYPIVNEKNIPSGLIEGHYFKQDLLVAQKIFKKNPKRHLDIGSRVDGFVAHVATFRPIEVADIRENNFVIDNISFVRMDFMNPLPKNMIGAYDSLSSLHALEHFGLGRYGDPVDAQGYLKGLQNFTEILAQGGTLYLSVPIGKQTVLFNAHRIFSVQYLLKLSSEKFELISFSYIDDKDHLFQNIAVTDDQAEKSFGCKYGCGIFEFRKK